MEVNRAESVAVAVAAVAGVSADVIDAGGRLVVTPDPFKIDGQRNVPADLHPGESLAAFLGRHVPGIECGAWTVSISGYDIPQAMWAHTFPKHGQLVACRALPARSALQLVALAALTYFSGGIASAIYGAAGGTYVAAAAGTWISAIQAGVFIAGSVLINKVLGPKVPSVQSQAQKQIYSLSDQRNTARPYEPIPVLWGEMRVTPDLASKSYAWYEGDDQYLSTILLGGVNVHSAADLSIGDTPIGSYSDVSIYYNGFPGMDSQNVPLYSNVDAVAGAEFVNGGDWITRTGSAGAGALQLDIEGQLYDVDNKGNIKPNSVDLTIEARLVGAAAWSTLSSSTISNSSTDVLRRTYSFDVAPGQYEVRAKLGFPRWNDGGSGDACKFSWVSLKSVQADTTDYSQWGRIGIKIRASGQLSGSLDQVRATYRAKPMPIWTGTEWATATTRENGLSNPGAILLQALRGVWVTDSQGQRVLQFGFGLSDEQIDIEGLKAFMLHCAARGYTYDKWITSSMSLGAFCEEVALAGMGEFAWTDGSRPTAVFVTNGQPNSAVVNMANMLKGGFSVDYALSNAADGIEYQWLNRDTWEMTTLRVMAPGVTTMLSPARVTGEGITSEAHAAIMARYHLAQSLYQYKTVRFTADIEHLDYRRLSVLSVSHDLTQWGFGGRVMAAQNLGGAGVLLQLDEPVPPLATAYIGLRVPGARDYRVFQVEALETESDWVTLAEPWPSGLAFPGDDIGNPAHDTLWCYDFKATPGYRVRVTSIDPESDLKGARITAVPEGPEFWDYVLNGTYVPAPNQSSIPQLGRPVVKNLRVSEKVNLQGDTEWYELSCVWDVEGECDHAQVWAGRDGSELRMVDGNAQGARSTFRIDGAGEWLIEVRPFNANGQSGQAATLLFITAMTGLPPRNPGTFVVQQVAGALRRFAWAYGGDRPAAFAGVQIRYLPGEVPLSEADWDAMQPLGEADDIYTAQFETTKPGAGTWTFGLRAIDTAGQLANGVMRFVAMLDEVFDNLQEPDLTPPPAAAGIEASSALANIMLSWEQPAYTEGHGHQFTRVYAAEVTAAVPSPGLAQAEVAAEIVGPVGSVARALGTSWRLWFVNVSNDGVESAAAGPLDVTVGKIGNTDLGALVVEAGNLANGAVSASKLAVGAVDATKFASGIEPVTIVTGASLPTVKSTSNITFKGQLYTWNEAAGKYESPEFNGSIGGANLVKNAALITSDAWGVYANGATVSPTLELLPGRYPNRKWAKVVAQSPTYTLGLWQTTLPYVQVFRAHQEYTVSIRVKSANLAILQFAWNLYPTKLYRYNTAVAIGPDERVISLTFAYSQDAIAELYVTGYHATMEPMPAGSEIWLTEPQIEEGDTSTAWAPNPIDLPPGSIHGVQIADDSITAPKLVAGSVVAGKLAANAVSADNLQVGAVVAGKLAADAVTAGSVAAGAIGAREIAAKAITTDKLLVTGSGTTINADPYIQDAAHAWTILGGGAAGVVLRTDAGGNAACPNWFLAAGPSAMDVGIFSEVLPIDPSKTYSLTANLYAEQGSNRYMYVFIDLYDAAGAQVQTGWGGSLSGYTFGGIPPFNRWTRLGGQIGANTTTGRAIPQNARSCRIGVLMQNPGSGDNSLAQGAQDIRLELASDASLIVKGSITADKLAVGAIAAGSAAIQNGAIGNAMIGDAAIDNAKIASVSASKITAGYLQVGSYIASTNYVAGSSGFAVWANGNAEYNSVTIRGVIYSTSGVIGGININANGLNAGGFSGWAWPASGGGFHLGPNGLLLGNYNTGQYMQLTASGTLTAPGLSLANGNATFSGNLSAASGTFSGTLTAQNIVTTGNLQTNAATVALGATLTDLLSVGIGTEILGLWVPAGDANTSYVVTWFVQASSSGRDIARISLQVDGGTYITIDAPGSATGLGTCSFSAVFSGNGLARYVRLVGQAGGQANLVVRERTITVVISKR